MDPITAAIVLATKLIELTILIIESQPEALRAEIATQQWKDLQAWRAFFEQVGAVGPGARTKVP